MNLKDSLKDSEIVLYKEESIKEAMKEFRDFRPYYHPAKSVCDGCDIKTAHPYKRNKFKKGDYSYCHGCLVKKVFGEWEK